MNMFGYMLWSQENPLYKQNHLQSDGIWLKKEERIAEKRGLFPAHETGMQRGSMALIDGTQ